MGTNRWLEIGRRSANAQAVPQNVPNQAGPTVVPGSVDAPSLAPAYPVVSADPYMLRSGVSKQLEHIAPALDATIRRRCAPGAEAE